MYLQTIRYNHTSRITHSTVCLEHWKKKKKKDHKTSLKYYHLPEITQSTIVRNLENKCSTVEDIMQIHTIIRKVK